MKRTLLTAALIAAPLLAACGAPAMVCDKDNLLDAAQACPDRSSIGFAQEFGSGTIIGTSVQNSVSVRNGGVADLNISSVTFTGDGAFTMHTSPESLPAAIKVNQALLITVYFSPDEAKAYTGSIVVASDAANEPSLTIGVSGCGVPADGGTSPCYGAQP